MTNGFSQACNACCSELAGKNIWKLCISDLVVVNARRLGRVGAVECWQECWQQDRCEGPWACILWIHVNICTVGKEGFWLDGFSCNCWLEADINHATIQVNDCVVQVDCNHLKKLDILRFGLSQHRTAYSLHTLLCLAWTLIAKMEGQEWFCRHFDLVSLKAKNRAMAAPFDDALRTCCRCSSRCAIGGEVAWLLLASHVWEWICICCCRRIFPEHGKWATSFFAQRDLPLSAK